MMTDFKEQRHGAYYDLKPLLMGPVWRLIFSFFFSLYDHVFVVPTPFVSLLTGSRRSLHRRFDYVVIEVDGYHFDNYLCL